MEDVEGVELMPTNDGVTVSPALDGSQNPLAGDRTDEEVNVEMENVPTAKDGASFEEERIECLNKIILENVPRARERDIRPKVFAIKLFTEIEALLFEPSDGLVDGPEELYDLTERGRINGHFGDLLKDPWFIGRSLKRDVGNRVLEDSKEELGRMSKNVMDSFSDVLRDYANGHLDYHFSSRHDGKRPHANVHHPDADRVHLLLAGLGDPNESLTSWEDVFHRCNEKNMRHSFSTTVIDLPGYGKTRLLFEAVEKHFLIYFTCSKDKATWTTGSGDVQWVVETVNTTSKRMYEGQATQRAFYVLMYARMYVLASFLDLVLSLRLVPFDARHRLLLLQACPPSLANSEDLFVHIAKVAQSFNDETLRRAAVQSMYKLCDSIKEVLHGTNDSPRISLTFDEVHIATRDPWLSPKYSLFPRMLEMMDFCLRPRAIVCAASQMSVNMLNIGSLSPGSWLSYASNTRRLQSDDLEEYILQHLKAVPPGLLERIKMWLYPRPRLVARLLEMYLTATQNGVKRIPYHRILSSVFEVSTGYRPVDAIDLEAQEEEIPEFILGQSFGCGVWEHNSLTDPTFMMMVSRLLYRWMLSNSSTLTLDWNESAKFIELGITPLPSLDPQSPTHFTWDVGDDVALTEAYGAASLMALLGSPGINVFKLCMNKAIIVNAEQPELEQTQKDIFERSIAWTFMNNLGKEDGCVLDDIFDFHDHAPLWTKQPYRLISFARGNNVPVRVTWKSGASPRLGFRAREPDDIERWLKDPKGVPFIFMDDHHCLTFIENQMTLERSVLVVHGTLEGDCEIEKKLKGMCRMPVSHKKGCNNFTIKNICGLLVGLAWYMTGLLWLICKVIVGLLGPDPAPVGQPLTSKFSQNGYEKSSDNLSGKHCRHGVQHQHVVYSGIKDVKGIEKGRLGLLMLSSSTQLTAP